MSGRKQKKEFKGIIAS